MRSFHSSRHFEAARYWSQSEHSYAPDILLISQRAWQVLRRDDRELLRELARASVAVMREHWDASEATARQAVLDHGIRVNQVDMPAFIAAAAPLRAHYLEDAGLHALHRQIRALA